MGGVILFLLSRELGFSSEAWGCCPCPQMGAGPHWRDAHSTFSTLVLAWAWHSRRSTSLGMPPRDGGPGEVACRLSEGLHLEGLACRDSMGQCHFQTFFADPDYSSRAHQALHRSAQGASELDVDLNQLVLSSSPDSGHFPSVLLSPLPLSSRNTQHQCSMLFPVSNFSL